MSEGKLSEYGISFQNKVISNLIHDVDFLRQIVDITYPHYFDNDSNKWVVDKVLKYYSKYKTVPTLDYFKSELKKVKNDLSKVSIKDHIKEIYSLNRNNDAEYIKSEFTEFCVNQNLKSAINNSVDLLDAGDYDSIRKLIDNALKAGNQQDQGHDYKNHIEERYQAKKRKPIPTPWEPINVLLQGGLSGGDLGVVAGNPGGGKSWLMIAIAGHAVRMGYNVSFFTLELDEDYVGKRFDAYFTNTPVNELDVHSRPIIEQAISSLSGNLEIKRFKASKTTLGEIETYTERQVDNGFRPDLIVVDYLDLLKVKNTKDKRNQLEDLYTEARDFGKEFNCPIWSPSQVNRSGAREEVIEGDQIAESYSKLMIADFAMSLSRTKEDKTANTGRIHIMKNRYGGDGFTFNTSFDASKGHIEVLDKRTVVTTENSEISSSGSTTQAVTNFFGMG
jgi:replicative DNA helicase